MAMMSAAESRRFAEGVEAWSSRFTNALCKKVIFFFMWCAGLSMEDLLSLAKLSKRDQSRTHYSIGEVFRVACAKMIIDELFDDDVQVRLAKCFYGQIRAVSAELKGKSGYEG